MSSKFSHGITCFLFLVTIFAIKAKADDHHQDHSDHSDHIDHIDLDVKKFGAKGDGKTDDTAAFSNAWQEACRSKKESVLTIPKGTYIVGKIEFMGPCEQSVEIEVEGTVQSSDTKSVTGGAHPNAWITFQNIKNLSIYGEGTFDGKGVDKDCPSTTTGNKCTSKPMNLLFFRVTNAEIGDITSTNSDYVHIGIFESTNVLVEDVNIYEMGSDGILIKSSTRVNITNVDIIIYNSNCITISNDNSDIHVEKMHCEAGNGLGIGPLGTDQFEKSVKCVTVKNCTFGHTEGGIRIESYHGSQKPLEISNLVFEDIIMDYTQNTPIILNQELCIPPEGKGRCEKTVPSNVKISNVSFKNVKGTTVHPTVVKLSCGEGACNDVKFNDMSVNVIGGESPAAYFDCKNVKPIVSGTVQPSACNNDQGEQSE